MTVAPVSREDAYTLGGTAGLSRPEVDAWWDYYEAAGWRFRANDRGPMAKEGVVASLRNWRRRQAKFGQRRSDGRIVGGAKSSIRDCTDRDHLTEEQKEGIAKNGW
jgi:hypothetical protein